MAPFLSPSTLETLAPAVRRPEYDRQRVGVGIVHFGPGAFHRVHQAWFAEQLLRRDPRWGISAVALRSGDVRDALAPQDGLYTLVTLDEEISYQVIGALRELLVAPEDPQRVLQRLTAPATGVVTITVTEKGYCLRADGSLDYERPEIVRDLQQPHVPTSLIGYLVEALDRRRAAGTAAPTIISCDNLIDNGTRLAQWVMEDRLHRDGPDWAGAGVLVTGDVAAYERAKLRLLNGAHSTLAYVGSLAAYETVSEAMADPTLAAFLTTLMREDIRPSLLAPRGLDLSRYIDTVLARFRNPALRHGLAQIAWDGSQKLPFRLFGTLADALEASRPIARLCVPIAAWMHFIRRKAAAGEPVTNPLAPALVKIGRACENRAATDLPPFLALESVFPRSLASDTRFLSALGHAYDELASGRIGRALG